MRCLGTMRRSLPLALLAALVVAGCGDDSSSPATAASGRVIVSAASSLQTAFTAYADAADIEAKQSFAGSDALAAQIRQGVTPDVYAAANTSLPEDLYEEGLVEKPVVFATNTLVLAVAADSDIDSINDLTGSGVPLAIGQAGVPVGDYTREVLGRLPADQGQKILANVRSEEPDAASIVGKLTQGAVNAGFVYATDVVATKGALRSIDLPANLEPDVAYGVAVVDGADNPAGAQQFIDGLLDGDGAEALEDAGFGPPPAG